MKILVYALAKHFSCSPKDIQELSLEDFNDYLEIMKYEHVINKEGTIPDRRDR